MALIKIGYRLPDIEEMSREEATARLLAHNRLLKPPPKKKWDSEAKVKRKKRTDPKPPA